MLSKAGQGKIFSDMSMSLDVFIAGPNDGTENPLGDGANDSINGWTVELTIEEPKNDNLVMRECTKSNIIKK